MPKRATIVQKSQNTKFLLKTINFLSGGGPQGHRSQQGGGPQGYRGPQGGGPQGGHRGQPAGGHRGHQGGHQEHRGHQEALSSIAATLNQMNLNTNQAHDRPPPGTREGAGGPPQVLPPAVIPPNAINPQAAAAIAALAASNDADSAPPGGLEPHYQAYNGTPTGWAAPPPRHPQWQEPEPQQQQQQPPPTLLSSSTQSSIQVQAVSYFQDFFNNLRNKS